MVVNGVVQHFSYSGFVIVYSLDIVDIGGGSTVWIYIAKRLEKAHCRGSVNSNVMDFGNECKAARGDVCAFRFVNIIEFIDNMDFPQGPIHIHRSGVNACG